VSSKAKQKGTRFEYWLVGFLARHGIKAHRQVLSGSHPEYKGDVIIDATSERCECKHRQQISSTLWDWLEGNSYLFLKRDYYKPLVVMTLDEFIQLKKETTK